MNDRIKRDCTCPRARHQHGTELAYKRDDCRCEPCTRAAVRAGKMFDLRKARGLVPTYEPVTKARQHIGQLIAQGTPLRTIAEQAGVPYHSLREIHTGHVYTSASSTTIKAILRVRPGVGDGLSRVGSTGSTRRVRALMALGHSGVALSNAAGVSHPVIHRVANGGRMVSATAAAKIRAVYDELWDQAPDTSTPWKAAAVAKIRGMATERGWLPPMALDDDRIDDPSYRPRGAAVPA